MVKSQKVPAKDEMRYTCIPFAKKELNFNTTCYLAKKDHIFINILQISSNLVMAKTNSQLVIVFCLRRTVVFESLKDY